MKLFVVVTGVLWGLVLTASTVPEYTWDVSQGSCTLGSEEDAVTVTVNNGEVSFVAASSTRTYAGDFIPSIKEDNWGTVLENASVSDYEVYSSYLYNPDLHPGVTLTSWMPPIKGYAYPKLVKTNSDGSVSMLITRLYKSNNTLCTAVLRLHLKDSVVGDVTNIVGQVSYAAYRTGTYSGFDPEYVSGNNEIGVIPSNEPSKNGYGIDQLTFVPKVRGGRAKVTVSSFAGISSLAVSGDVEIAAADTAFDNGVLPATLSLDDNAKLSVAVDSAVTFSGTYSGVNGEVAFTASGSGETPATVVLSNVCGEDVKQRISLTGSATRELKATTSGSSALLRSAASYVDIYSNATLSLGDGVKNEGGSDGEASTVRVHKGGTLMSSKTEWALNGCQRLEIHGGTAVIDKRTYVLSLHFQDGGIVTGTGGVRFGESMHDGIITVAGDKAAEINAPTSYWSGRNGFRLFFVVDDTTGDEQADLIISHAGGLERNLWDGSARNTCFYKQGAGRLSFETQVSIADPDMTIFKWFYIDQGTVSIENSDILKYTSGEDNAKSSVGARFCLRGGKLEVADNTSNILDALSVMPDSTDTESYIDMGQGSSLSVSSFSLDVFNGKVNVARAPGAKLRLGTAKIFSDTQLKDQFSVNGHNAIQNDDGYISEFVALTIIIR